MRLRFLFLHAAVQEGFRTCIIFNRQINFTDNFWPFNFFSFYIINYSRCFYLFCVSSITGSVISGSTTLGSFFVLDFLGRVDESIVVRSILSITFGPSISGASIFTISGSSGFGGCASTGVLQVPVLPPVQFFQVLFLWYYNFRCRFVIGFIISSLLNVISSSSFLFLSVCALLGISTWSAFVLATLSL